MTLVVLVVLSLSIISLDLNGRTHSFTSGVKSVANEVYSPLRDAVVDVLSPIGDFFAGAVHYRSLQSQNQKLQAALGEIRLQNEENGFDNNELHNLTELEHLPFLGSLPTVMAETEEIDSSNFTLTITIDKGRADGVDVGMAVVGAGGLVGQVIQSFHDTAVVQLITDGQSKVGVTFGQAEDLTGTVDGQGPNSPMTADLISAHTPLSKNELMYTSSLDAAAFPRGIPVARVRAFHSTAGASEESVTVTPVADLNQLAYVDVVIWEPAA